MYKKESANTHIKTLYSPDFSSLMLSYYRSYLILKFVPYIGKDKLGYDQYCKKTFLSTSIDSEGALLFHTHAASILSGKEPEKSIEAVLPRNNGITLTFEYKPDQNNLMSAYLGIKKNNVTIPFRFSTYQYQTYKDGQWVTRVLQVELDVFLKILEKYLTAIGIDEQWNKIPKEEPTNQQKASVIMNAGQY